MNTAAVSGETTVTSSDSSESSQKCYFDWPNKGRSVIKRETEHLFACFTRSKSVSI